MFTNSVNGPSTLIARSDLTNQLNYLTWGQFCSFNNNLYLELLHRGAMACYEQHPFMQVFVNSFNSAIQNHDNQMMVIDNLTYQLNITANQLIEATAANEEFAQQLCVFIYICYFN